jgi:hypothetical protein
LNGFGQPIVSLLTRRSKAGIAIAAYSFSRSMFMGTTHLRVDPTLS